MQNQTNRKENQFDDYSDILEPMMPGRDAPSSRPPERDTNFEKRQERLTEIFAQENAKKDRILFNLEGNITALIISFAAFWILYYLVMGIDALPDAGMLLVAWCPAAVCIGIRMYRDGMSLQSAAQACRINLILSACFFVIVIVRLLS